MPEGTLQVVLLLALGYVLLFFELFLPGGILGLLGVAAVGYACYLAFELSTGWGLLALGASLAVAGLTLSFLVRSRAAKKLFMADDPGARDWRSAETGLEELVGQVGRTLTALRPAGQVEIGDRRVDVVADNEFLDAGIPVRVCEVEGNRVVVESVETEAEAVDEAPGEPVTVDTAAADAGEGGGEGEVRP